MRYILLVALVLIAEHAVAADFTATGVGGGGWLHAAAFLPEDSTVIVIGSDVAGAYRSDDFGATWSPWNQGLSNPDEKQTQHIEDLVGATYDGWSGFYAATQGGIYSREEGYDWECETQVPEYSYDDQGAFHADAIPFSCVDWRSGNSLVVAGAGRLWFGTDYELNYYPGLDSTRYDGAQLSVWLLDLEDTSPSWAADSSSEFGPARDISYAVLDSTAYIAVGTTNGIYLKDAGGWHSVGDTLYGSYNLTCWSLHLTQRGTLYAAMQQEAGATHSSGVYRLKDVRSSTEWKWVGDSQELPPTDETIEEIGDRADLVYLSVVEGCGDAADLLYLACRGNDGLFRGYQRYLNRNTCTWSHKVYYDYPGFWYTDALNEEWELDVGWLDYDGAIMFHPIVSEFHSRCIGLHLSGRIHVSDCKGDGWLQRYTTDEGAGYWQSKGYNELCVADLAFFSDGRVAESTGDVGLFRSDDASLDRWDWLRAPVDPESDPTDDETCSYETGSAVVRADWMGCDQDALFVVSGDLLQQMKPCKLFMIDSIDVWHNVTASLDSDRYLFWDLAFSDDSTCFMPYTKYSGRVGSGSAAVDEFGVLRGSYGDGEWSWSEWNAGLTAVTSPDTANAIGTQVICHVASGRVFLAARAMAFVFENQQSSTEIPGALYMLESPGDSTWQVVCGGANQNWRDFRCLAQSDGGEVVYAGTRGRSWCGWGSVLKCANPGDSVTAWAPLANTATTGYPFGFDVPFWYTEYGDTTANRLLTDVRALAVDPSDPDIVYASLYGPTLGDQLGLWKCDSGSWDHLSPGEIFEGVSVTAIGLNPADAGQLVVGAYGQELYYQDLSLLRGRRPRQDPREDIDTGSGLELGVIRTAGPLGRVEVDFSLRRGCAVEADVFDVLGRVVRSYGKCPFAAGRSTLVWDGRNGCDVPCAPGVYFVRLRAEKDTARGKLVLLK